MTDRFGYSVEITLTRGEERARLYINCRTALRVEIREKQSDPEAALAQLLGEARFLDLGDGCLASGRRIAGPENDQSC